MSRQKSDRLKIQCGMLEEKKNHMQKIYEKDKNINVH